MRLHSIYTKTHNRSIYCRVLPEGIYIHDYTGLDPATLKHLSQTHTRGIAPLYMSREYRYRQEDDPSDIVKLTPLLTSSDLNILPDDPESRKNFKGVKIYYGFKIDPRTEDPFTKATGLPPSTPTTKAATAETGTTSPDLWSDIQSIVNNKHLIFNKLGVARYGQWRLSKDADLLAIDRIINDPNRGINLIIKKEKEYDPKLVESLEELKLELEEIWQRMKDNNLPTLDDLMKTANKKSAKPKPLKAQSPQHELGQKHLRHASISLAKKIKKPETPEEEEMASQVIKHAAAYWTRMRPSGYDIITFPDSGASFNTDFVRQLQSHSGYEKAQVVPLSKLDPKDVTIDVESIHDWAQEKHKLAIQGMKGSQAIPYDIRQKMNIDHLDNFLRHGFDLDLERTDDIPPTDPEWVNWRTAITSAQLEGAVKAQAAAGRTKVAIKAMVAHGIRWTKKFVNAFMPSGLEATGKTVLIVDDNVAYSATMQIVHDLVHQQNPRLIDIYTPFYMGE